MSNDSDFVGGCLVGLLTGVIFAAIFLLIQCEVAENRWRNDAVKHGHAVYYLDGNNERQWRWKGAEQIERKETK